MKTISLLCLLISNSLSAWSQAFLAYTKESTQIADSHFVALRSVPKGEALYILPHKTHHGLHLHNGYYWAVHVRTHQEGFVPAHFVIVGDEIPFASEGSISYSRASDIQNPVLEIKNSSKQPLRIKLGEEEHEVSSHKTLTLHLKKGKYYYRVTMPEIANYYSVETLDEYKLYTWDFYVHQESLE